MEEIWKDIKGFEELYQVSNLGNVKRLETMQETPYFTNTDYRTIRSRILKPQIRGKYLCVRLCKENTITQINIHRIVAETFISNPSEYPIVMHLDNDKWNNKVDNLQWGTLKQNSKHAVETGVWNNQYTI